MSPNETETLKTEIPKMNENRRALTLIPYYMHLGVYIWKKNTLLSNMHVSGVFLFSKA